MKHIFALIPLLAIACGSPESESSYPEAIEPDGRVRNTAIFDMAPEHLADIPVPGQEGRIDGSVWADGIFNDPLARDHFCGEWGDLPEAWFCRDIGSLEQGWISSEYHGISKQGGGTCYGATATAGSGDCYFPEMKHFRIIMSSAGCYVGQAPPNGPSLLQENAILFGIQEGVLQWNNLGGSACGAGSVGGTCTPTAVVLNGTPGTDWYAPLTIDCQNTDPGAYAQGGLQGNPSVRVGNLPVGPNSGKDQDDAIVLHDGILNVNIPQIWTDAKAACGGGSNITELNLRKFTWAIGVHEGGHVLGFRHFNANNMAANVMYPTRSPNVCQQNYTIPQAFKDALGAFDTVATPGPYVINTGLQTWLPQ